MLFPRSFLRSVPIALVLALAGCSNSLTPDELLLRGQQSLEQGKLKAAQIDAKTALQQDPANAAARLLLGQVMFRQRDLEGAAVEFGKSLASAKDAAVAVLYAQSLLGSGQQDELLDLHAKGFFAFASRDPEVLALLARAQATTGDTFTAEQTLAEATAIAPDNPQVRLASAVVLAGHTGDVEQARAILQSLTEDHPEFEDGWSLYGTMTQAMGDYATAQAAFTEASRLNHFRLEDRLGLVAVLVEQEKYEEATRELDQLDAIIPDQPGVNYAQARIAVASGNTKMALEELAAVLNVAPDHLPSVYLSALANYQAGNFASAETQLDTLLAAQPRNVTGRQMLATVYLRTGRAEKATRMARQLLEELPMNTTSMNILAMALAAQGMHAASAQMYGELAGVLPESAEVRTDLGSELVRAGEVESGIEALQRAKKLDPDNGDIRSRLILALAVHGDQAAANEEIELYRQLAPNDPRPSELAAKIALIGGDREKAAAEFSRALELDAASSVAREGLAALAMQDDDSDRALAILNEGLQANPGDLQSLLNLAAVYEKRGELDAMASTLQRAIDANPKALEPRLMLARYNFKLGKAGETVSLLTEVRADNDDDPRLHQLLVGAFLAVNQPGAAVTSGRKLLKLEPDNLLALRLTAQAEMANQDLVEAEKHLRKVVELRPDDTTSQILLLEALMLQNKLEETSAQIAKLPAGLLSEQQLDLARGWIALKLGKLDEAEPLLRKAHKEKPSSSSLLFLSTDIMRQGKIDEALKMLEAWLATHPDDTPILNQLGAVYVGQGRDSDAVRVYEHLNSLYPGNPVILNNLAWSYRKTDATRATEYVQQALAIVPGNASVLDTQAMILLERGDFKEALAVSTNVLAASPAQSNFLYHRAQILAAAGDNVGAIAVLEKLVTAQAFPEKAQAKAMLDRLRGS